MSGRLIVGVVTGFVTATAAAQEGRRGLGAHEHGHSTLNIAIEGRRVSMELLAPGMDVVGFEHAAESDADRAAVTRAEATLGDPLSLFVLPGAAGCEVVTAEVGLAAEEHHGEGRTEDEGAHAEFRAEYALDCADPARIDSITFAFFERFPQAEEVEVTLVTAGGQGSFEVERGQPRLKLDRVS